MKMDIEAIEAAARELCGNLCPSVKRTGKEWTHVPMCKRVTEAIAGLKAQNAPPIGPPDPPACEHGVSFYPNGGMSARCSQCPSGKPEARKATKVANLKKSSEQSTVHSAPEGKTQGGAAG